MGNAMVGIRLGDTVEWTSQARGFGTTKRGRVVFVHPLGERLSVFLGGRDVSQDQIDRAVGRGWLEVGTAEDLKAGHYLRRCDYFGPVVVKVERFHQRTGARILPAIYSPRPKWLCVVEGSSSERRSERHITEPDLMPPERGIVLGWSINVYARRVSRSWSGSVRHGDGHPDSEKQTWHWASQNGVAQYSTFELARKALREKLEEEYDKVLRGVDALQEPGGNSVEVYRA